MQLHLLRGKSDLPSVPPALHVVEYGVEARCCGCFFIRVESPDELKYYSFIGIVVLFVIYVLMSLNLLVVNSQRNYVMRGICDEFLFNKKKIKL